MVLNRCRFDRIESDRQVDFLASRGSERVCPINAGLFLVAEGCSTDLLAVLPTRWPNIESARVTLVALASQ